MNETLAVEDDRSVAIVGMGCQFPGAPDRHAFWVNQLALRNCVTEIPANRWNWKDFHGDPNREEAKTSSRWGAFLSEIDRFDPLQFEISPSEAEVMDPQHRLFIKVVWEAILDAGYRPASFAGTNGGVFVGVQFQEYQQLLLRDGVINARVCTGNAQTMLANRVSYLLDVTGPSQSIDTSCSSSLIALHHAVAAIRSGACNWAIAGGANLLLAPDVHIMGSQLGVLSPTGQCRPLDADANGYVRGEGVGAVMLKSAANAKRDGDHIYALIRGTASNHGGRSTSLTAPNPHAQAAVMRGALADARLTPDDISYVEMHATGTIVGDPVEYEAVKSALGCKLNSSDQEGASYDCVLSSVKANIGHLEAASGIAGIINASLALHHQWIPGMSNFRRKNPKIDLDGTGFRINDFGCEWRKPHTTADGRRAALVNSFGFGGSNCSVALQEYVDDGLEPTNAVGAPLLIPVSAATEGHLREYGARLAAAVETATRHQPSRISVEAVAHTMQHGRQPLAVRRIVKARTLADLCAVFKAISLGNDDERLLTPGMASVTGVPSYADRWLAGGDEAWPIGVSGRRVPLPSPPWNDSSYWYRELPTPPHFAESDPKTFLYLQPAWKQIPRQLAFEKRSREHVLVIGDEENEVRAFGETIMAAGNPANVSLSLTGESEKKLAQIKAGGDAPSTIFVVGSARNGAAEWDCAERFFELSKVLFSLFVRTNIRIYYILNAQSVDMPEVAAVSALAKSVYLENKRFACTLLYIDRDEDHRWRDVILDHWQHAGAEARPCVLKFDGRDWHQQQLEVFTVPSVGVRDCTQGFRRNGVYLLAGGTGELGRRLSAEIARRYDAKVVLLGRSDESAVSTILRQVRESAGRESEIVYLKCDVNSLASVKEAVTKVENQFGAVHGVFSLVTDHRDAFTFKKRWIDFVEVSSGKVRGTRNLDEATAHLNLDLFVLFSSQAALGMAGASDYAYGCEFENQFAILRNCLSKNGSRSGRAYAINWSRWRWDKHATDRFDQWAVSLGYEFLEMEKGMECLEGILERDIDSVYALYGEPRKILSFLDTEFGMLKESASDQRWKEPRMSVPTTATITEAEVSRLNESELISLAERLNIPIPHASDDGVGVRAEEQNDAHREDLDSSSNEAVDPDLFAEIKETVRATLSRILKIEEIDAEADLASLGLDSIIAVDVMIALEERFAIEMSPTWLFEYPSVSLLADRIAPMVDTRNVCRA